MASGKLYIVPTPIGNLEDMTLRAMRILKEADLVLMEDTRTSGSLLAHYGIEARKFAYHMHNEHKVTGQIIDKILHGDTLALISDAGTPGISDPGFMLVREALARNIEVECLPGATAFVPALINSGLPSDHFLFEGFLPHKKGRQTRIRELSTFPYTIVLYESPHRLVKSLQQFAELFGPDRMVGISRELTKLHEENFRGTLDEAVSHFGSKPVKGEIVIVLAGYKSIN